MGEGSSGHYEKRTRLEKDPVVDAFIALAEGLRNRLKALKDTASQEQTAARSAIGTCKERTCVETEHLSGIYYDERYITYRDGTYRLADAIEEQCNTSIAEIEDRISTLDVLISDAYKKLWITVTYYEWVSD